MRISRQTAPMPPRLPSPRSLPRLARLSAAALFCLISLLAAGTAHAAAPTVPPIGRDPLAVQGYERFYLLDYPAAIDRFERLRAAHPGDPQPAAMLLEALIFQDLYRQDLLDTTFYANDGFLTGRHATQEDPAARGRIFAEADEIVRLCDQRLDSNPRDTDALYARGWTRALRCAYMAMVQRSFSAGFRLALKANSDHRRLLEIDPNYVDAKLVTGVYQYVVGALPLPFKILIGFAGMTGSKSEGLALLNDVATHGPMRSVEAKTVIALFLRREARYPQAIEIVHSLKTQFPHGFLFWLEEANLRKDDGQGMAAVESYRELLAHAARPGYFADARPELAYFGLGDALRGQRHFAEAAQAYEQAGFNRAASPELRVRSMLAAGECHDLTGDRRQALRDYQMAIDAAPNTSRADQARRRLKSPFTEK